MPSKQIDKDPAVRKKDGKTGHLASSTSGKLTAKYTLWRTKQDIKKLEELRDYLKTEYFNKSWVADSKIYKDLPDFYLNAVKRIRDLDHQVDVLTAKLAQLDDIRTAFCRIFELSGIKK